MKSNLLLIGLLFFAWSASAQLAFQNHLVSGGPNDDDGAYAVYSADIDGDGDMDVISAASGGHTIAWYENLDGKGTFGQQRPIAKNILFAWGLAAADLDGDGDVDVLSTSSRNPGLAWYENLDGKGTFGPVRKFGASGSVNYSVHVADVDGDGDMDVISDSEDTYNTVWHENTDGKGTFSWPKVVSNTRGRNNTIASADMDGDGDIDIVTEGASPTGLGPAWFENTDGQGTFGTQHALSEEYLNVRFVHTTDINNDGHPDVLLYSRSKGAILWFKNADDQGNFDDFQIAADPTESVEAIYPADVDGDGDMDILVATVEDDRVAWYENTDGQGTFGEQRMITNITKGASSVFAVDLDGDGDADVLSASGFDDKIAWYENTDGQGAFGDQQRITREVSSWVASVYAADLDGDGDADIVSVSPGDGKVAWHENRDGLGDFGGRQVLAESATGGTTIRTIDLDVDGDLDIVVGERHRVFWLENTDGRASFGTEEVLVEGIGNAHTLQLADVDGDGDLDLLTPDIEGDQVNWYEHMDGRGSFSDRQVVVNVIDPNRLFSSDLDNDGDLDVVWSSSIANTIGWAENSDGKGTFVDRGLIATDKRALSIFVADADGDGDNDLFLVSVLEDQVVWYENMDGLGDFATIHTVSSDLDGPSVIYATDLDNDGDVDLLAASIGDDELVWYRNLLGRGIFGSKQVIAKMNFGSCRDLYAVDLNQDGAIDILSAFSNDRIYWHESRDVVNNKIEGIVQLDLDGDGCDGEDVPASRVRVNTSDGTRQHATLAFDDGSYQLFCNQGGYTTSVLAAPYFRVEPAAPFVNFTGTWDTEVLNFCLSPTQSIDDLNISLYPTNEALPGLKATYHLRYHNAGTRPLSGAITLTYDSEKCSFESASANPSTTGANTLQFPFIDLAPFETQTIDLTFELFPAPDTELGDTLIFTAQIESTATDITPSDNIFSLRQNVFSDFKLNDMQVLEGPEILLEEADDYLHYLIRFQNNGTQPALRLHIRNELDERLDWSTLQLESTSHELAIRIENGKEVNFLFDDINLPHEAVNEEESYGFVAYKIKPQDNVSGGDIIFNQADVIFDFNEDLVTNQVRTEIIDPTSTQEIETLDFRLYPVPTTADLHIKADFTIAKIEVYDLLGHLLLEERRSDYINLSRLQAGIYFCRIVNGQGQSGVKKVVKY
ncbi:MAG: T9SS type A sorting domain-containing protein [Bacteroidota bacterium]